MLLYLVQRLYYVQESHGIVVTDLAFLPDSLKGRSIKGTNEAVLLSVAVDSRCQVHAVARRRKSVLIGVQQEAARPPLSLFVCPQEISPSGCCSSSAACWWWQPSSSCRTSFQGCSRRRPRRGLNFTLRRSSANLLVCTGAPEQERSSFELFHLKCRCRVKGLDCVRMHVCTNVKQEVYTPVCQTTRPDGCRRLPLTELLKCLWSVKGEMLRRGKNHECL